MFTNLCFYFWISAVENIKPICEGVKVGVAGTIYDASAIVEGEGLMWLLVIPNHMDFLWWLNLLSEAWKYHRRRLTFTRWLYSYECFLILCPLAFTWKMLMANEKTIFQLKLDKNQFGIELLVCLCAPTEIGKIGNFGCIHVCLSWV